MGGEVVRLDSVDADVDPWTPFMAPFKHWSIAPVGPIRARVFEDLVVVTVTFEADGQDAEGRPLLPKPGQYGTLLLERTGEGWRAIRQNLTAVPQPKSA